MAGEDDPQALPKEIARREALRDKLDAARRRLEAQAEAQAAVDAGGSQLIVGARVSQCASDRNDLVADIEAIPSALGPAGDGACGQRLCQRGGGGGARGERHRGPGVNRGGGPSANTRLPSGEGSPGGKGGGLSGIPHMEPSQPVECEAKPLDVQFAFE